MPNIKITVAGKIATNTTPDVVIVCGNSDYSVTFDLDAEWAAETDRTARFTYIRDGRTRYKEKTFQGNTVAVPMLSGIRQVTVGLYAGTPDDPGDLHTTTAAAIWCKPSILCGDAAEEITPAEKAGLQSQVDKLALEVEDLKENGTGTGGNGSGSVQNVDLTGYAKEAWVREGFQPKGNYLTEVPDGYAKTEDIPTKPEDIGAQPKGDYATPDDIPKVSTWAMQTSKPTYTADEVGALPKGTKIPAKTSELTNDSGYQTAAQVTAIVQQQMGVIENGTY